MPIEPGFPRASHRAHTIEKPELNREATTEFERHVETARSVFDAYAFSEDPEGGDAVFQAPLFCDHLRTLGVPEAAQKEGVKQWVKQNIARGSWDPHQFGKMGELFGFSWENLLKEPEYLEAIHQGCAKRPPMVDDVLPVVTKLGMAPEAFRPLIVKDAAYRSVGPNTSIEDLKRTQQNQHVTAGELVPYESEAALWVLLQHDPNISYIRSFFTEKDEVVREKHVSAVVREASRRHLAYGSIGKYIALQDACRKEGVKADLPKKEEQQAALVGIRQLLERRDTGRVHTFLSIFDLPKDVLRTPEMQATALQGIQYSMNQQTNDDYCFEPEKFKELIELTGIPPENLRRPDMLIDVGLWVARHEDKDEHGLVEMFGWSAEDQAQAKEVAQRQAYNFMHHGFLLRINADTFVSSPENVRAVLRGMRQSLIDEGVPSAIIDVARKLGIPEADQKAIARSAAAELIADEKDEDAQRIEKAFQLEEGWQSAPEIQKDILVRIYSLMKCGNIDRAVSLKKKASIPEEVFFKIVQDAYTETLQIGDERLLRRFEKLMEEKPILDDASYGAATETLIIRLFENNKDYASTFYKRRPFPLSPALKEQRMNAFLSLISGGELDTALDMQKWDPTLTFDDVKRKEHVQSGLRKLFREGQVEKVEDWTLQFQVSEEEKREAMEALLCELLSGLYIAGVERVLSTFPSLVSVCQVPKVQEHALKVAIVARGPIVDEVMAFFAVTKERVKKAYIAQMEKQVDAGTPLDFSKTIGLGFTEKDRLDLAVRQAVHLVKNWSSDAETKVNHLLNTVCGVDVDAETVRQALEVQTAVRVRLSVLWKESTEASFARAQNIAQIFHVSREAWQSAAKEILPFVVRTWPGAYGPEDILKYLKLPTESLLKPEIQREAIGCYIFSKEHTPPADLQSFLDYFGLTLEMVEADERMAFFNDASIPALFRNERSAYAPISPTARRARITHCLAPEVYDKLEKEHPEQLAKGKDGKLDWEALAAAVREKEVSAKTDVMVLEGRDAAVSAFGAETAMRYGNRPDLATHDLYYFLPDFIRVLQDNGVHPERAKGLLLEISKDMSAYEEGTALHRFGSIVQRLSQVSVARTLALAAHHPQMKAMHALAEEMGRTPETVFTSWKLLKKFDELNALVARADILERLEKEPDEAMRRYVKALLFHTNIDGNAVLQFWQQPAAFLEIDDIHATEQINTAKKPSNLLSLPHLGLKGEDVRDALVRGELDDVQTLPPMEREYYFGVPNKEQTEGNSAILHGALRKALGEQSRGVKGTAANASKLFKEVQTWSKANQLDWKAFLSPETGPAVLTKVAAGEQTKLRDLVYHENFGIRGAHELFQTYRVVMGKKSDPEMVIAGNDTASCMPFGSGKNNVYMFNPNCVQLVVQRKTSEGTWRTAAQSVVTLDVETGKPTPEIVARYQSANTHLHDLVDIAVLARPPVVTCDNIEIAKNEEGNASTAIRRAYESFFKEYLGEHAKRLGVDTTRVAVGMGNTPSALGLPSVQNTFVPLAPMGYSDNVHATCFLLETGLDSVEAPVKKGLTAMGVRDVLAVATLEGKAYHDNNTLLQNLHGLQNDIIGMEIANRHFTRPNLSLVYRDGAGLPRGYILAYEGVSEERPEIFVSDLAADPESKRVGGPLMAGFLEAVLKNYGTDAKPFIPIFANAREQTSYAILQKKLGDLSAKAGILAEMVELDTYDHGGDTMHNVRIFLGKTKEDIEQQKQAYA